MTRGACPLGRVPNRSGKSGDNARILSSWRRAEVTRAGAGHVAAKLHSTLANTTDFAKLACPAAEASMFTVGASELPQFALDHPPRSVCGVWATGR